MRKPIYCILFLVVIMIQFTSCNTHKKLVYFQQPVNDSSSIQSSYTPTLKTDDLLSIIITGEDPLAVAAFNMPTAAGVSSVTNTAEGYLIDANGNVQMPVLGTMHLSGLNRMEAIALLHEKLSVYINNPVVNIQILNFKVTILGEVNNPGTFKIPNERITLLEAIGLAGDLEITGVRKNVLVIRDNNGKKEEFRVDLTDSKLFSSPVYYLQQNDVIYVEPNFNSRSNSTFWRSTGPVFISLTSLIITTIVLITQ